MELWAPVALFFLLGVPVAAFVALVRTSRLRGELDGLRRQILALQAALDQTLRAPPAPAAEPMPWDRNQPSAPPPAGAEPVPELVPAAPPAGSVPSSPPRRPPAPAGPDLEERFASRWLVWAGGATIALGGGFLVKYSIDNELLGPLARVVVGLLLSLALIAAGEWLRRQPLQKALAAIEPSYVPPALTAAGLATGFASVFAAYALYGLLPPLAAFAALAGFSAAGVALSLHHGPLIAALGFAGGMAAPLLVATGAPQATLLFPYLFLVLAGTVAVQRYMTWPVVGWLALAGGAGWPLLWLATTWRAGDAAALGAYLVALFALFAFVPWRGRATTAAARPFQIAGMLPAELQALVAGVLSLLLAVGVVRADDYQAASLVALLALSALALFAARREPALDALPVAAAALAVFALAIWHLPRVIYGDPWAVQPPVVPPGLRGFLSVSGAFALLFGGLGFAALWGARRPGLWAGLAAASPLAILAAAYWRVTDFDVDLAWATASLAAAALYVVAAERVGRWREAPGMNDALGAFAAAAVAAIGFACAASLREAWLTVALAMEVAALGWLHGRLGARGLRECAGVLAAIVLARLVANPFVFDYPLGAAPGLNWLLYGYGLPALAFWWAARRFRQSGQGPLPDVLDCAALAFATLLVTLEIRSLMHEGGRLDWPGRGLPEASLQTLAWLTIAAGLHRADAWGSRLVTRWGWRVLGALAAAQLALVHLLALNPLFDPFEVGRAPVLNWLLVAYGAPAVLLLGFAREAHRRGERRWAQGAACLALVLVFAEVSLEVRRAFQGSAMRGLTSDAEWWAHSAAWLVYAGALLALAIRTRFAALRYASLALVMLTAAKVFLFDMSALTGLWRALSFLGLGLSLVAVGWLYQRFVFPPRPKPA